MLQLVQYVCALCVCVCVFVYAQSCLILCHPVECSPPGSSLHGSFQARILGWFATSSSMGSSRPKDWTGISCISCFAGGSFTAKLMGKPVSPIAQIISSGIFYSAIPLLSLFWHVLLLLLLSRFSRVRLCVTP